MGTNYYAVKLKPSVQRAIHIGKSSGGWKFLFERHDDAWNDPPVVWNTYNQVVKWLERYVDEAKEYVILDEYDEQITLEDFKKRVTEKQKENNPEDFLYADNVDGYRFIDGEFW